jgi:hypothetical protein
MPNRVHHVPGRLRVRVAELKNCAPKAAALESELAAISGITRVECRIVTGSVIVYYDPRSTDLTSVHKLLGCPGTDPQAFAIEARASSKVGRVVLLFALEKAIECAVPALLASIL